MTEQLENSPDNRTYIPEYDYISREYKPFKEAPDNDMCGRCEKYYETLFEKGLTSSKFPPRCEKHVLDRVQGLSREDFDTEKDFEDAQIVLDPVAWAYSEFGWEPRWYQTEMLSCTSPKKLYRCGRRTGKTTEMIIEMLYEVSTNTERTVLVVAPFERQITHIFDEMNKLLLSSATLKSSIKRQTKSPSRVEFKNGSKILGFSAGAGQGSGSVKIRGQDAHMIVIDEIDYLEDADVDAVLAILASHPGCKLIAATTPAGWRKRFYSYVTNKDSGFKEFWFISAESPNWGPDEEKFFRNTTDEARFAHEYLADFAESEDGVFKADYINNSLQDYNLDECRREGHYDYILGIDWNKSAGTHMVILESSGTALKLAKKIVVPESQYMQTDSVDIIIRLHKMWGFKHIFVDAGYGTVQVELLKKEGLRDKSSRLESIVHSVHMNQYLDVLDPITSVPVKKFAKPYLVDSTKKLLEDGNLILPKSEDTTVNVDNSQMGLVQQMRNFRVEKYSVYGLPKYSQGEEHTLTAYLLACGGFFLKEGSLSASPYNTTVRGLRVDGSVNVGKSDAEEEYEAEINAGKQLVRSTRKYAQKSTEPTSRSLEADSRFSRGKGLGGLRRAHDERRNVPLSSKKDLTPIKRKNI